MSRHFPDPYEVLGLSAAATDAELTQAHRALQIKYHPDKFAAIGGKKAATAAQALVDSNAAFEKIQAQRASEAQKL